MSDNGIKVSRGFTFSNDDGTPNVDNLSTCPTGFLGNSHCTVVWTVDFAALEADAKAWREQRAREPKIKTPCPSCGSQSLFVPEHGLLTCSVIGCREPAMLHRMAMSRGKRMEAPTPSLAERFPVGRKVRVVKSTNKHVAFSIGKVGTVGEVRGEIVNVDVDSIDGPLSFVAHEIELLPEDPTPALAQAAAERIKESTVVYDVAWCEQMADDLSRTGSDAPAAALTISPREAKLTQESLRQMARMMRNERPVGWEQTIAEIEEAIGLFDAPTPAPWVPKVGDKVRFIDCAAVRADLVFEDLLDKTGEIVKTDRQVKLDDRPYDWRVQMPDGSLCWAMTEWLEPAPTPEPTGPGDVPHHCANADILALAERLESLADPCQRPTPSYADTDWRTLSGVSATVIRYLFAQLTALREKLAAVERERDEARTDRDREAREFEREAFLRFLVEIEMKGEYQTEGSINVAKAIATKARAAMFSGEVKA